MKSFFLVCAVCAFMATVAVAQDVGGLMKEPSPRPGSLTVAPSAFQGLMKNPNLSPGSIKIADPAYSNVNLQDSGSRSILDGLRRSRDDYFSKQKQIDRERQEASQGKITALEVQKDRELEEYRQGLFCSGCNRTRSDILSHGEEFPHSGQHVIKATQEQLDAKAKDWDAKIARAKVEQQNALLRLDRLRLEQQRNVTDAEKGVLQWKEAVRQEDDARAKGWENELAGFKQEVALTREAIHQNNLRIQAEKAQGGKASQELLTAYQNDLAQNEKHLGNIALRAGEAFGNRKTQSEAFTQSLNNGLAEVGGILSQVGGQMLTPPAIGGFGNVSVSTPSALPLSASFGAGGFGLSGNLGALRVSLSQSCDWLRDQCKIEVTMASTLPFLSSMKAGMRQTTKFGADGVTQTSEPILKAGPISVDDLMKKDDSGNGSSGGKLP